MSKLKEEKNNGVMYSSFVNLFTNDKDRQCRVIMDLSKLNTNLPKQDTIYQKNIINRYLVSNLLNLVNEKNINLNNALYSCDIRFEHKLWLETINNTVLPVLIKHKRI